MPGASPAGIGEDFPLAGARTLYGATKLSAELLIEEYRVAYGLRAVVDRCGVIAGPWQMGKVDQGVFTYWMLAHYFQAPLRYIGFGGLRQAGPGPSACRGPARAARSTPDARRWDGATVNVGGGRVQPFAERNDRAVRRDHRRSRRTGGRGPTWRRACLHLRLHAACSRSRIGDRDATLEPCWQTSTRGSRRTSARSWAHSERRRCPAASAPTRRLRRAQPAA